MTAVPIELSPVLGAVAAPDTVTATNNNNTVHLFPSLPELEMNTMDDDDGLMTPFHSTVASVPIDTTADADTFPVLIPDCAALDSAKTTSSPPSTTQEPLSPYSKPLQRTHSLVLSDICPHPNYLEEDFRHLFENDEDEWWNMPRRNSDYGGMGALFHEQSELRI